MVRHRIGGLLCLALMAVLGDCRVLWAAEPRAASDRYRLELVASEPEIVTPIGMAFDRAGRLLVVESHTHERSADYGGLPADRIRIVADSDGDGRLDRWDTFAEGFRHALNLLVRPDGGVYLVTRSGVWLLRDTDGDGRSDEQSEILRLETENDYSHNGLSGIAQLPGGDLLVGQGENHGMPYRLVGSDGTVISGQGGEGGVFRITPAGRDLRRVATGFWNPFGLCALADGRMFAVDNDPDASPPCRLLHVVDGADFGFRYQYGRAGNHPLQAWNGELPGTRPMVCGVGEAPTAIVAHAGSLWVTSWGDHRIERYTLVPQDDSYAAEQEVVVQGDTDFRPTGMAVAPDGSLYFGDWRLRNYEVHGTGRLWRLIPSVASGSFPPEPIAPRKPKRVRVNGREVTPKHDPLMPALLREHVAQGEPIPRSESTINILKILRNRKSANSVHYLRIALADDSADVRLYAVRWIADERIVALRDDVAKLLEQPPPNARYYLAVLAALDWLDNEPGLRSSRINDGLLVRELRNEQRSPAIHTLALRLLSPDEKYLTADRMRVYLESEHEPLRLEAVRSLSQQTNPERFELLAATAGDTGQSDAVRAEAVAGLAAAANEQRELLDALAAGDNHVLQREATRVLRLAKLHPPASEATPVASDLAAWNELLATPGDADAGRRLFFSSVGPRCAVCHQFDGRGGRVGPDLTHIGRSTSRERIIASILQPNLEIAPEFQCWLLLTTDGQTRVGLRQHKSGDDGLETYVDAEGRRFNLRSEAIETREASDVSIMPGGLEGTVSIADLRDLVTFLTRQSQE